MTDGPRNIGLVLDVNPEETEGHLREVDTDRVVLRFDLSHPFAPVVAAILWDGLQAYARSKGIPTATFSNVSVQ